MHPIINLLFRRKALIFVIFGALFSITIAYTVLAPRKYQSRMKIFVKHQRAESVVTHDYTNAVIRGEVSESDVNSEIELLTSTELLRQVVLRNGLERAAKSDGRPVEEATERAVRRLAKDLVVTPIRKASVIYVEYSSGDPAQTATVLSTVADLYLQSHLQVHRTAGSHDFFRAQADLYERRVADAQDRLAQFRRRNNIVLLTQEKDLILRRVMDTEQALSESNAALGEATNRAATLNRQLASLQPRVVTQSRVLPNQYSIERLHTMLTDLQNRRTAMLAKFQSNDRLVIELDKEIEDTSTALARAREMTSTEQTTDVNPVRQTLEAQLAQTELTRTGLESRRSSLTTALAAWRSRLSDLDNASSEHERLSQELKESEENFVLYSKKTEEARIADSLDEQKIANVSIAEPPSRPYLPSKPNVPLYIAVGFVMAVCSSISAALALEMIRTTFESEQELEAALKVPVLASVWVDRPGRRLLDGRHGMPGVLAGHPGNRIIEDE